MAQRKRDGDFTQQSLSSAVQSVKEGMKIREAANLYGIPKSTLHRKVRGLQTKSHGGQTCLTPEEESIIVNNLIVVGEWGFPFSSLDLRVLVKSHLDMSNRKVSKFKDNLPGEEWARSFIKRHKTEIRPRLCQNIKTKRAEMNKVDFEKYFENLKEVLNGVPPQNILNYNETNLSDDPGQEKLIFKRREKYTERIMNYTKGSTSIMFCGTATGELLPVYVVYKAINMWNTWTLGGPKGARFNRSKSGWFDAPAFDDWFRSIVLPWARRKEGRKVIIGDNLSSHFSPDVITLCDEQNISFVCLVPNSTHLSQPLDVAFYGPLKRKWRKILKLWKVKNPCLTSLPKDSFPSLLKELVDSLNTDNLISGFRACGIHPFNPQELISKLPQSNTAANASQSISSAVLEQLKRMRSPPDNKKPERRKRVAVEPGKSVSVEDLNGGSEQDEPDNPETEVTESEVTDSEVTDSEDNDSENSINESDKSRNDEELTNSTLSRLIYTDTSVGDWVKVLYEGEVFIGKILQKTAGETMVQCLEKPFGIKKEPQNLEREQDAVFYENV